MPRRLVGFEPEHFYHIYNRGCDRRLLFFERDNYVHFLRLIRRYLSGPTFDVVAYCLMPNHYHLLVRFKAGDGSEAMKRLGLAYTKALNKRYQRQGTLFQGRFRSISVDRAAHLAHLVPYIHLNPVKAGMVAEPGEWEFSSYLEYAGLRDGTLPQVELGRRLLAGWQGETGDRGEFEAKLRILLEEE